MKYPLKNNQTIEYDVLHAMESGARQALWVESHLSKAGIKRTRKQIYGAMQRLRKDGVIEHKGGLWLIVDSD
jgi:DNA-binding PadR family transcriptional regulator